MYKPKAKPPNIFRSVRKALGLTQIDVSDILHITQAAVSKMELNSTLDFEKLKTLVEHAGGTVKIVITLPESTSVEF